MRRIFSGCCARAASGHAAATPLPGGAAHINEMVPIYRQLFAS
jgi:hypothetical protein